MSKYQVILSVYDPGETLINTCSCFKPQNNVKDCCTNSTGQKKYCQIREAGTKGEAGVKVGKCSELN